MLATLTISRKWIPAIAILAVAIVAGEATAQRRPIQIGGPNGIVFGGGLGFKMGGRNGVQFGGGQGARFGPPEFGMQFGGGQGARFGSPQFGMQFGNGEGARFGAQGNSNLQMQFGGGKGAKFGPAQIGGRDRANQAPATPTPAGETAAPIINAPAQPTPPNQTINIRYPAGAEGSLDYTVNGSKFSFAPGTSAHLRADRRWDVQIPTGNDDTVRRYTSLKPGNYVLRKSDSGWQLFVENKERTARAEASPDTKSDKAKSILQLDDPGDK